MWREGVGRDTSLTHWVRETREVSQGNEAFGWGERENAKSPELHENRVIWFHTLDRRDDGFYVCTFNLSS